MTRWSGNWYALGRPVRCVEGRLWRHDSQWDDPDLETDVGPCPDCRGAGCDEPEAASLPDPDFTHPIPPEGPAEATAHRLNAWMAEVLDEEEQRD